MTLQLYPAAMAHACNSPQVSAATVSSSFIKPQVTPAMLLSGVQTPLMPQATVPSRAQTFQLTPAKMTSGCNSPQMSAATVYSSYSNPQVTPVHSSVQILQMNLAAMTIGCNSPHVSAATVSSPYNNPWVTPATFPRNAESPVWIRDRLIRSAPPVPNTKPHREEKEKAGRTAACNQNEETLPISTTDNSKESQPDANLGTTKEADS